MLKAITLLTTELKLDPKTVEVDGVGNLATILQHYNYIDLLIQNASAEDLAVWDLYRNKPVQHPITLRGC